MHSHKGDCGQETTVFIQMFYSDLNMLKNTLGKQVRRMYTVQDFVVSQEAWLYLSPFFFFFAFFGSRNCYVQSEWNGISVLSCEHFFYIFFT